MSDGLPRGADGLQVCEWCGRSIVQPPTGRRRRYCRRTCRELAYRERRTVRRVAAAVEGALAAAAPETSVDETGGAKR